MIRFTMVLVLALGIGHAHAASPDAGKEKSRACAQCHGADGNSAAADFPRLAGQHPDYLVQALKEYKSGARKNPIMQPQVANLTVRDMEDIAAFYAKQSGLKTRKHAYVVR